VKLHARVGRVQLQIESRGFTGFLFLAAQPGQAIGKGVGNAEFH
jgi:hypothetical protein